MLRQNSETVNIAETRRGRNESAAAPNQLTHWKAERSEIGTDWRLRHKREHKEGDLGIQKHVRRGGGGREQVTQEKEKNRDDASKYGTGRMPSSFLISVHTQYKSMVHNIWCCFS